MHNTLYVNDDNPWPGLESYNEAASRWFYGREEEADALMRLVERENLSVLYGRSGMGKTSLIQAGLFPRLREAGYLPIRLHLVFADDAPSLLQQIGDAITSECENPNAPIDAPSYDGTVSLWEYFHKKGGEFWSDHNQLTTPVLVFDQFEEIFTLGRENPVRMKRCNALLAEIGDLVENRCPVALREQIENEVGIASKVDTRRPPPKILLSFREDYLADFEILYDYVNARFSNRIRLLPMTGDKAQAAIVDVGARSGYICAEVAAQIVRFIDPSELPPEQLVIEPVLLSLVCQKLNEYRQQRHETKIDADWIADGSAQAILDQFFENAFAGLDPKVRYFVEDHLITVSGDRDSYAFENAIVQPGVTKPSLQTLIDRRVLRRREGRGGKARLEIIHDVLIKGAKASRDTRRQREEGKAQRRHKLFVGLALLGALAVVGAIRLEIEMYKVQESKANKATVLALQAKASADQAWVKAKAFEADAEKNRAISVVAKKAAITAGKHALSRKLAIQAQEILDGKSEQPLAQGVLLAVEAYRLSPELLTRDGMMKARQQTEISYIELPPMLDAYSVFKGIFYQGGKLLGLSQRVDDKEKKFQLWNITKQDRAGEFSLGQGQPPVFTFSRDGKIMAKTEYAAEGNYSIQLFDMVKHKLIGEPLPLAQGPHQPSSLALREDGNILAVAVNGDIQLWDVNRRRRLDVKFLVDNMNVNGLAFSPDGKTLAAGGSRVYLFDADSGESKGRALQINGNVSSLVFSPDNNTMAIAVGKDILLWDVAKQMIIGRSPRNVGGKKEICFLAFSPDSNTLAVAETNSLRLLDWRKIFPAFKPLVLFDNRMGNFYSSALSMDGKIMAMKISTDNKNNAIQLWDVIKGEPIGAPLAWAGGFPLSLALSMHGETMAMSINYKGNAAIQLWDVAKRVPIGEPMGFKQGNSGFGSALAFSPDGKTMAAGGGEGIQLFDVTKRESMGKPLSTTPQFQGRTVASLAFSWDGKVLAAGGDFNAGVATKNEYRAIQLWDVAKRELRNELVGLDQRTATSLAFSQDGKTLAVGCGNGTIGSGGGAIQLWDLDLRRRLKTELIVGENVNVKSLAFSRDGKNLLAIDGRSLVSWDLDIAAWPAHLCNQVQRNLTALEWADSIGDLMLYHKTCPDIPKGK